MQKDPTGPAWVQTTDTRSDRDHNGTSADIIYLKSTEPERCLLERLLPLSWTASLRPMDRSTRFASLMPIRPFPRLGQLNEGSLLDSRSGHSTAFL